MVSSNYQDKSELFTITDKNKAHARPCQYIDKFVLNILKLPCDLFQTEAEYDW